MRTPVASFFARLLLAVLAMGALRCTTPATQVLVVVDTDARSRVLSMRATVSRGTGMSARPEIRTWSNGADGGFQFPASFGIVPGTTPNDGSVTLQVTVQFAPATTGLPPLTAIRTARFRFTPHAGTFIRIFIPLSCSTAVAPPARCADGRMPCSVSDFCEQMTPSQTCGDDGRCSTTEVMPQPLGADGSVPTGDTPNVDAVDATDVPTDVCVPQCTGRACGPNGCGGTCGACATSEICGTSGTCAACTAGAACDPGDPCATGSADCTGGTPTCTRSGNQPAGTTCPGGVCNGSGTCVACVDGSACDTGNPCTMAITRCSSGGPRCEGRTNAAAGAACPGGVCDGSGTCVACMPGASCATANPCVTAQIDCSTGAAVCNTTGNVGAGMACTGGVCNGSGTCVACTTGASCSTGNPCTTGQIDCASGSPMCMTTGNVGAGTACPGGVCDGAGHCSGCAAGAMCTPSAGECFNGSISCATGMPVCASAGARSGGSACTGGVCNGSGACVACSPGATCSTGSECTTGTIDCGSGTPLCSFSGNRSPGTSCSGGVCNGSGTCVACAAGTPCSTGSECVDGQITCGTGSPVCTASGNRGPGTPCTGGVCNGTGLCVSCTPGAPCMLPNACLQGTISCGSGTPVCMASGNQPPGTACPGGFCDGAGTCVPCSPGAPCGPSDECSTAGMMSCASGPMCTPGATRPEYSPCTGGFCRSGVCTPCTNLSGCMSTGPGVVCNDDVNMSPYATGGPFGGFQSTPGTSFQTTITVTFAIPVNSVSVTILDPDFGGNAMEAYDSMGTMLGRVNFNGDGAPGSFSMDTQSIAAAGIARLMLIPDPSDYVAYGDVSFSGCF